MDETRKPLLIPPEFSNYAEKNEVFQTIEHLMKQLVIHQPDDPLAFLVNILEHDEKVPEIVVQGPPASGKRTMSKTIAKTLGCVHINLANLFMDLDSPDVKQAQMYFESKKEVPTDLWISMIHERLKKTDCIAKGWVLEGFPSSRSQALALQVAGIIPKHFVLLDAQDTVLIERAVGKRIDPQTGDIYHATFDPATEVEVAMRLVPDTNSAESIMIQRLNQYHRNIDGVLSCYKKIIKKINADQPKTDVFSQVHSYLCSNQYTVAPHTPRVLLLGATGSGKSVQASLIARKYNLVSVNCDVLIKQSLAEDSKLGEAIRSYKDKGMEIPDDLILQLLRNRLSQLDCVTRGWVLHAFPTTRRQAEALSSLGFEPNRVLLLDVPKDTILERLTLRSTDPQTGERYHLLYNPPRTTEVKQRLQTHPEDQEDRVTERFLTYQEHIEDIADYYERTVQHINADQDPHTVFEYIESMIVNPLPRKE
ncbi:adenylate kinase 8-like [Dendronephthya gigantea]|uniref:adenylate kinase 8-like n=1 Tax=Dendronephthya gigantea TaxID=151771 RepID=UPI00106D4FF0|nr:adenylate kinase 8-like [Dendronephthya gigantea]